MRTRSFRSTCGTGRRRVLHACMLLLAWGSVLFPTTPARAQQTVELTLTRTVDLAMEGSYHVRQLQLGIERTRSWLQAERAGLKSRVYVDLRAPEIEAVSNHKWNSGLHKYEIVRENNRRLQADVAIRQPVVLFGYPTNGYLSLNNRMYRYTQLNGGRDITYYNRYYVRFEQPFFQPNHLKNNIEEAELNLENEELKFQENIVGMFDDLADDYYDLFELAYQERVYADMVAHLQEAVEVARELALEDTARAIEVNQVLVELTNAREQVNQSRSNYRLAASRMKQSLRLDEVDSLYVDPTATVTPITVDLEQAVDYGYALRPELRRLAIQQRHDEIGLNNAEGWGSFRANLEVTYGRESQDPLVYDMWEKPTNSYSVALRVHVPVWDWGRHGYQMQAKQIRLQQTELRIEHEERDIRSDIQNHVQNVREYQQRTLTMKDNLEMAREIAQESLRRYASGDLGILGLLQSFQREEDTAENFLAAYLGYRKALVSLSTYTHYDFEQQVPLLQRLDIDRLGTAAP